MWPLCQGASRKEMFSHRVEHKHAGLALGWNKEAEQPLVSLAVVVQVDVPDTAYKSTQQQGSYFSKHSHYSTANTPYVIHIGEETLEQ